MALGLQMRMIAASQHCQLAQGCLKQSPPAREARAWRAARTAMRRRAAALPGLRAQYNLNLKLNLSLKFIGVEPFLHGRRAPGAPRVRLVAADVQRGAPVGRGVGLQRCPVRALPLLLLRQLLFLFSSALERMLGSCA